jgi:hypothetical protein
VSDRDPSAETGSVDRVAGDGGVEDGTADGLDDRVSDDTGGISPAPASTDGENAADDDTREALVEEVNALRARARRLEEENDRLREQYASVRESRYTRTALGLAGVGVVFGLAGLVVTSAQEVLFAIAAAGLFGAVLTRYLTPERFVPHDVSEGLFAVFAENEAAIASQLGLSTTRVYLTTDRGPRLFVPEVDAYDRSLLDDTAAFDDPLVVDDSAARSGLVLRPSADPLLHSLGADREFGSTPTAAAETLAETVTEVFELATHVESTKDPDENRLVFEVTDSLFGSPTRFDHPVVSLFGAGLASALETPVTVDVTTAARDGTPTTLVTCRWSTDGDDVSAETVT